MKGGEKMKAKKQCEGVISLILSPDETFVAQKFHQLDLNREMVLRILDALIGEVGKEVKISDQYNRITVNNEDYFQTG